MEKNITHCGYLAACGSSRALQGALAVWMACCFLFMAAMSIGISLFALVACLVLWSERKAWWPFFWGQVRKDPFGGAALGLASVAILSLVGAKLFPALPVPLGGFGELRKLQYFFYPFLTAAAVFWLGQSEKRPFLEWPLFRTLLVFAVLATVAGFVQFWAPWFLPDSFTARFAFFRPMSIVKHFHAQGFMQFHLSFASVMFFPLSFVLAKFFWGDGKKRWLLAAVAFAAVIFFSYSRVAWVALMVLPVVVAVLRRPRWALPVLCGVAVVAAAWWYSSPDVRFRFTDGYGIQGRMIVWKSSWEMVKDRPVLGVGFGKTGVFSEAYGKRVFGEEQWFSSHAHNNFLDTLAATGILGLAVFLAWWGVLLGYALRLFRGVDAHSRVIGATFLLAAVCFHVNGLTQVNFYDAKSQHVLVLFAGLVYGLEILRRQRASSGMV